MPKLIRHLLRPHTSSIFALKWVMYICVLIGSQNVWAEEDILRLALPGDEFYQLERPKDMKLSTWVANQRWSSLSLRDGVLVIEPVTTTTNSDQLYVSGKAADRLLEGKALRQPPKPKGISLKPPVDTLLMAHIESYSEVQPKGLTPGQYPSSIEPSILKEGWMVKADVNGVSWKFYTRHKKRLDGKLLAGSLEILADQIKPNGKTLALLPEASGMAFAKQELLWLGDLNNDGEPDLLLKRTWLTGEFDYALVVTPMFGLIYLDPDKPASYFSSGVDPDSNEFVWNKNSATPTLVQFTNYGSFTIGEEEWIKKLYPKTSLLSQNTKQPSPELSTLSEESLSLPILLTDRSFKLNDEVIRFTLEHLPRASDHNLSVTSASGSGWGGSVLVRATFRGRTQVLMEAGTPDSGIFNLSVGYIDGEPAVKVNHQPHYNNSFSQYWIYDKTESRFRRLLIVHSQGC